MALTFEERLHALTYGSLEGLREFYQALLKLPVYVPLPNRKSGAEEVGPMAGERFVSVQVEGRNVVPVFSQIQFLADWSPGVWPTEEHRFSALLWLLKDDTWLHLNPGQPAGKEISPWEISLLRKGEDAIEELVADAETSVEYDMEVQPSATAEFPEFVRRMRVLLEAYSDVEEAFVLAVRSGTEEEGGRPFVGIRWKTGASPMRAQLLEEVKDLLAEEHPNALFQYADDLHDHASPHAKLFSTALPFYIAQQKILNAEPSLATRIMDALWRRKEKDDGS